MIVIPFLSRYIWNKNKVYIRRWRCAKCNEPIVAIYDFVNKCWLLKCNCGMDNTFKKIRSGIFKSISKGVYPID